jgi:hypothetical protein
MMHNSHLDLAKILEAALVSQAADQTFVKQLNNYAGSGQRLDVVSVEALSDQAPYTDLGVELALREAASGRREFFKVRIERGELVLPHTSAARTLLLSA